MLIESNGVIEFGNRVVLAGYNQLFSSGRLTLGSSISINEFSRIVAFEKIEIGSNVAIAKFVTILDHDHAWEFVDGQLKLDGYTTSPVKIGNNVLIGDKVSILKGVTIGDNVILAANAVVTSDIPADCIAGGIPAKVIKHLNIE